MRLHHVALVGCMSTAAALPVEPSPPVCPMDDVAMLQAADAVAIVEVLDVEHARQGENVRVAVRYRVLEAFKGRLRPGARFRLDASCLDRPVPREEMGYPIAQRYCRGGPPQLTGAASTASPNPEGFLLFLQWEYGAWQEMSRTGTGSRCSVDEVTLGPADSKALARLRAARPEYTLAADLHVGEDLRHGIRVGIKAVRGDVGAVQRVTYLLREDTKAARPGDDREVHVVEERGGPEDGMVFVHRHTLQWIPRALLAVVDIAGRAHPVRLASEPFQLPDPSLRVGFVPIYETKPVATTKGLEDRPCLEAFRLSLRPHPARPGAVGSVREVAVAIGRSRPEGRLLPTFQRFPMKDIAAAGGSLELGTTGRRALDAFALTGHRDYVWLLAIHEDGVIESYATWRPIVLDPGMSAREQSAARAAGSLEPQARAALR